jgi:hypothetical protein
VHSHVVQHFSSNLFAVLYKNIYLKQSFEWLGVLPASKWFAITAQNALSHVVHNLKYVKPLLMG